MSTRDPIQHLVSTLQERGIDLGRDDVAWAFESVKTKSEILAWTGEYLHCHTLLTRDELDLYRLLGSPNEGAGAATNDTTRPILEPDLQTAIRSLEASTAAIDRHTKVLENQITAFQTFKNQDNASATEPHGPRNQIRGERLHESSKVGFTIEEISDAMTQLLINENAEIGRVVEQHSNFSLDHLNAHDRVLEAVSRMAEKTHVNIDHTVDPKTIDTWCRNLVTFRAKEAHARFDTMFLKQMTEHDGAYQNGNGNQTHEEQTELQTELSTLLDEISSVVEVVVAHEARQPLLRYLRASILQAREEQKEWSAYIVANMNHLALQADVLQQHTLALQNYAAAMTDVHSTFIDASTGIHPQGSLDFQRSSAPSTPSGAVMAKTKDRSVDQLLRRLNVQLSPDRLSMLQNLQKATDASRAKLDSQYANAEILELQTLAKSLELRNHDLHSALDKVYASSAFRTVRLSDRSLDGQLKDLDEQIAETAAVYAKLEANKRFDASSAGVTKLKQQWSR